MVTFIPDVENKGIQYLTKNIYPKMKANAPLVFELDYFDAAIKHFNH